MSGWQWIQLIHFKPFNYTALSVGGLISERCRLSFHLFVWLSNSGPAAHRNFKFGGIPPRAYNWHPHFGRKGWIFESATHYYWMESAAETLTSGGSSHTKNWGCYALERLGSSGLLNTYTMPPSPPPHRQPLQQPGKKLTHWRSGVITNDDESWWW